MTPTHITESERRTRKSRIDPKLIAWGWDVVSFDPARPLSKYSRHAIEEYPTANGPADYALVVDGQLLGVVEAKKVTLGPQNVLTQQAPHSHVRLDRDHVVVDEVAFPHSAGVLVPIHDVVEIRFGVRGGGGGEADLHRVEVIERIPPDRFLGRRVPAVALVGDHHVERVVRDLELL